MWQAALGRRRRLTSGAVRGARTALVDLAGGGFSGGGRHAAAPGDASKLARVADGEVVAGDDVPSLGASRRLGLVLPGQVAGA